MATIKSGNSTDQLIVDPTSKAARVTLYDTSGNALTSLPVSVSNFPADQGIHFTSPQHVIVDSATLGTVAVSGAFFQATQPVSIAAHVTVDQGTAGATAWKVDGSGVTQPVSIAGSVAVTGTFFQATQPVSIAAAVTVAQATAANLNATVVFASAQPVTLASTTVTGTVAVTESGAWNVNQTIGVAGFGKVTDGTNTASVKAASTPPVAADSALVVTVSPNTPLGSDTSVGTTALGALNAAISVALQGQSSVGFQLAAGTLIGTIVPELSYDNGASWFATQFKDAVRTSYFNSYVFAAANTVIDAAVDTSGGATNARIRVSAFTSGTANAIMNASKVGHTLITVSTVDGQKVTYRAGFSGITNVAIPALFQFTGTNGKICRITRIGFSSSAATGAAIDLTINRLSAIGTSAATAAIGKMDSNDPNSTSIVTRNSAGGTVAALIVATRYVIPTAPVVASIQEFHFGDTPGSKSIMVRSAAASETIGIGLSATGTTGVCDFWIEWTEE